jgi:hypothetical protein
VSEGDRYTQTLLVDAVMLIPGLEDVLKEIAATELFCHNYNPSFYKLSYDNHDRRDRYEISENGFRAALQLIKQRRQKMGLPQLRLRD